MNVGSIFACQMTAIFLRISFLRVISYGRILSFGKPCDTEPRYFRCERNYGRDSKHSVSAVVSTPEFHRVDIAACNADLN